MSDEADRARAALEEIASDIEVEEFLRLLMADGLAIVVDGKYVVLEQGEPSARVDIRITSQGGDS